MASQKNILESEGDWR